MAACNWVCTNAPMPSPALTFVLPRAAARTAAPARRRHRAGAATRFGDDEPASAAAARSGRQSRSRCSRRAPTRLRAAGATAQSLCGYFSHLSLPQSDFDAAREFWEHGGFVALPEEDEPFPHLPLTSDHLDLAFHQRRTFDAPLLVFECADLAQHAAAWRRN